MNKKQMGELKKVGSLVCEARGKLEELVDDLRKESEEFDEDDEGSDSSLVLQDLNDLDEILLQLEHAEGEVDEKTLEETT